MKRIILKIIPSKLINILKHLCYGNWCYFFNVFGVKENKIVVSNFYGKGYGGNGKYIVEEIINEGLDYDIVWMAKKKYGKGNSYPEKVRVVRYGSFNALYEMATAKIWIDNARKKFYPPKRKKQYYIQTWHASMGLKKAEKDANNRLSDIYIDTAKADSKMCDLMIAGSEFRYNLYRNSFWYDGEILKSGTPRSDVFFKNSSRTKEKVCKKLGVESNKKFVIFAPTFRNTKDTSLYRLDFCKVSNAIKNKFHGEWIFLYRLHPNVSFLAEGIELDEFIINVSNYEDMQELLVSSDILITDYSSTMFDMAMQNKVCLLHIPDSCDYLKYERELIFDFEELPFGISKSTEELISNIEKFDMINYLAKVSEFNSRINNYEDGNASKRIVDKIKAMNL